MGGGGRGIPACNDGLCILAYNGQGGCIPACNDRLCILAYNGWGGVVSIPACIWEGGVTRGMCDQGVCVTV